MLLVLLRIIIDVPAFVSEATVVEKGTVWERFIHLRNESKLCDVEIRCGAESFPAHRVVLAASSEYFEAMFTNGVRSVTIELCKFFSRR